MCELKDDNVIVNYETNTEEHYQMLNSLASAIQHQDPKMPMDVNDQFYLMAILKKMIPKPKNPKH